MKKYFIMLLVVCLCASLCACAQSEPIETTPTAVASVPQTEPTETLPPKTEASTEAPTEPPIIATPIEMSETVTIPDKGEFSIVSTGWSYDLSVKTGSNSRHSIAEASEGTSLFYLQVNYKNLSETNFNYNNLFYSWKAALTYDEKYEYSPLKIQGVFSDIDVGLAPLMSGDVYIVFEVPETFKTDGKSLSVSMDLSDNLYEFIARESGEAQEFDPVLVQGDKRVVENSGEITLVDTYYGSSLYPKNPSGYYSYYNAPDGYTFLISEFIVKNLSNESIHASRLITGNITIDGHEIEGTCILSTADGSNISNIFALDAMSEVTAYFTAQVPDDLAGMSGAANIMFANEKWTFDISE